MILQEELAGERGVAVEGYRCRIFQLLVAQRANRRSRHSAVGAQQFECGRLRDRRVLGRVFGVHCMDVVHDNAGHGLSTGKDLCQLDFNRVDAADVMDDDADRAAVVWHWHPPFGVGESSGERFECANASLEAIGERLRLPADRGW